MEQNWAEFITYLSMYSVLVPMAVGLFKLQSLNSLQRWIGLLVLVTLLGELGVYILDKLWSNNLPVIHLFTLAQFVIIVCIMERGLAPMFSKKTFRIMILFFFCFSLMDAFWWNGIYSFNNYSRPMASLLLLFLALCFFYKTLRELKIKHLEQTPLFWLSIGLLIYFSGNLFIFLFTNYVKVSNEALMTIWGIHAIFNIILNLTYSIALWIKPAN